jgi:hypothetical protein
MKKLPATHAAPSAASKQESANDKPLLRTAAAKTKLPTTSKRTCNVVAKLLLLLHPAKPLELFDNNLFDNTNTNVYNVNAA